MNGGVGTIGLSTLDAKKRGLGGMRSTMYVNHIARNFSNFLPLSLAPVESFDIYTHFNTHIHRKTLSYQASKCWM